jgi:hypothetical protein
MNLKDEDFWDRVERRVWDRLRANHSSSVSVSAVREAVEFVERENIAGLLRDDGLLQVVTRVPREDRESLNAWVQKRGTP